ncbi:UNVERIFIED_CONTAM: hypothetical protein FKN15_036878 [Acipenser sinensis]
MNTRCPLKGVPSAARFFTLCRLTVQPPQSYSIGGQRSSGQLTGKPAGARPDYRGRWCAACPGNSARATPGDAEQAAPGDGEQPYPGDGEQTSPGDADSTALGVAGPAAPGVAGQAAPGGGGESST